MTTFSISVIYLFLAIFGFVLGFGGMYLYRTFWTKSGVVSFAGFLTVIVSIPLNFMIYIQYLLSVVGPEQFKTMSFDQKVSSVGSVFLIVPTILGFELARRRVAWDVPRADLEVKR